MALPINSSVAIMRPRKRDEATPSISDAALIEQALSGDRWAEDALVRRYLKEVVTLVTRLMGSRSEVDDVVQETFLHAFEKLGQLREPAAFRGWLIRIAINRVRRVIRRRKLLKAIGMDRRDDDATLEELVGASASAEVRFELSVLDEVLRRAPAENRIAWMLRYVEGRTLPDVARLCCCSLATVKRRIAATHRRVVAAVDYEVIAHG